MISRLWSGQVKLARLANHAEQCLNHVTRFVVLVCAVTGQALEQRWLLNDHVLVVISRQRDVVRAGNLGDFVRCDAVAPMPVLLEDGPGQLEAGLSLGPISERRV